MLLRSEQRKSHLWRSLWGHFGRLQTWSVDTVDFIRLFKQLHYLFRIKIYVQIPIKLRLFMATLQKRSGLRSGFGWEISPIRMKFDWNTKLDQTLSIDRLCLFHQMNLSGLVPCITAAFGSCDCLRSAEIVENRKSTSPQPAYLKAACHVCDCVC